MNENETPLYYETLRWQARQDARRIAAQRTGRCCPKRKTTRVAILNSSALLGAVTANA